MMAMGLAAPGAWPGERGRDGSPSGLGRREPMRYVFAEYELDTRLYELRHAGQPCKLEPQVFNVLRYLIQHCDRVVTKDELLEQLWPHQFISEVTLHHRIMAARKAL